MKHPIALTVAALALPALIAAALPVDTVEFKPADGLALTRTYSQKTELSLDDMEMSINGQPSPVQIDMEMDMTMTQRVVVSDEVSSVSGGRPSKLVRSFDELAQQSEFKVEIQQMQQSQEHSVKSESELQGKKVAFTWDADSNSYKLAFEGEGDAALLEGLEEDMDLRVLLPTSEVKEGDTWQIDVKRLRTLLAYGGNLKLKPTEQPEGPEGMPGMDSMTDFSSVFGELLEGEATGEYRGVKEVDGVKCQVVHVKLDVNASADISDKVQQAMKDMPNPQVQSIKVDRMDLEMELDGEGELYWDPATRVAHSFELTGTTTLNMDMGMAVSAGETPMNIEQSFKLSGSFANSIAIRPN